MALKTFLNGVSKNLTPVGKPPVTFINGSKKVLSRGVTFINGQKVVLWDTHSLGITYINLMDIAGADSANAVAFFANHDRLMYSSGGNINVLNVENLGNITLDTRTALGDVRGFSSLDSDSTTAVYYARAALTSNTDFNQVNINVSTGAFSATNAASYQMTNAANAVAYAAGSWIHASGPSGSVSSTTVMGGSSTLYYYNVRAGGTVSGYVPGNPHFAKIDANTLVGRLQVYSPSILGIGEFTTAGYSEKVSGVNFDTFLVDGSDVACGGADGFAIYTKDGNGVYNLVHSTPAMDAKHWDKVIGKCRNNYYTVSIPVGSGISSEKYYLRVFNGGGVLVETIELTGLDPAPYSIVGQIIIPHVSKTGYLAFAYQPTNTNRKIVLIQCY